MNRTNNRTNETRRKKRTTLLGRLQGMATPRLRRKTPVNITLVNARPPAYLGKGEIKHAEITATDDSASQITNKTKESNRTQGGGIVNMMRRARDNGNKRVTKAASNFKLGVSGTLGRSRKDSDDDAEQDLSDMPKIGDIRFVSSPDEIHRMKQGNVLKPGVIQAQDTMTLEEKAAMIKMIQKRELNPSNRPVAQQAEPGTRKSWLLPEAARGMRQNSIREKAEPPPKKNVRAGKKSLFHRSSSGESEDDFEFFFNESDRSLASNVEMSKVGPPIPPDLRREDVVSERVRSVFRSDRRKLDKQASGVSFKSSGTNYLEMNALLDIDDDDMDSDSDGGSLLGMGGWGRQKSAPKVEVRLSDIVDPLDKKKLTNKGGLKKGLLREKYNYKAEKKRHKAEQKRRKKHGIDESADDFSRLAKTLPQGYGGKKSDSPNSKLSPKEKASNTKSSNRRNHTKRASANKTKKGSSKARRKSKNVERKAKHKTGSKPRKKEIKGSTRKTPQAKGGTIVRQQKELLDKPRGKTSIAELMPTWKWGSGLKNDELNAKGKRRKTVHDQVQLIEQNSKKKTKTLGKKNGWGSKKNVNTKRRDRNDTQDTSKSKPSLWKMKSGSAVGKKKTTLSKYTSSSTAQSKKSNTIGARMKNFQRAVNKDKVSKAPALKMPGLLKTKTTERKKNRFFERYKNLTKS